MKLTSIIAGVLTLAVLGTLYKRMIERETPEPVGKAQALVPAVLGAVSLPLAVRSAVVFVQTMQKTSFQLSDHSLLFRSMFPALTTAALPEAE